MRNMIPNRKEKGFTLIELVMVIVILGILAAFALPRFADLSGDAEVASIEGARGSLKSAMGIVHAKALAEGKNAAPTESETVKLEGKEISLAYGYLAADVDSIREAAQLEDYEIGTDGAYVAIANEAEKPCFTFTAASDSNTPSSVGEVTTMSADTTCGTTP
ncbi:type II secretion system protein [Marinobacter sp. ATCH36]|uniref:type II secretion system protein n=1 Tax=Marinobacter sp. ATCH36 TaxID=2945106 RepID=UPI0024C277B0|nr:type II secretion system protein [Marinobacter sp. ATCH36]